MTNWEPLAWVLLVLGTVSIVAGVYQTGETGDVSPLLITGMGGTTIGMVLHDELKDASTEDADSEPGESA